jgi:hypothetical protein
MYHSVAARHLSVTESYGVLEVETSQRTLAQLQRACERSFKAYIKGCREGHLLLAAVRDLPLSAAAQAAMLGCLKLSGRRENAPSR